MATSVRRGHGEGSVYRDAANATWVGAISLGWRPDGTRIRRKVTGRTKTEVRDKLRKLQAEADAGLKTSASYTVAKAVEDWADEFDLKYRRVDGYSIKARLKEARERAAARAG